VNIFKKIKIQIKGYRALKIIKKTKKLPINSMRLYRDIKKAGLINKFDNGKRSKRKENNAGYNRRD